MERGEWGVVQSGIDTGQKNRVHLFKTQDTAGF